jgi:hypothetical protein
MRMKLRRMKKRSRVLPPALKFPIAYWVATSKSTIALDPQYIRGERIPVGRYVSFGTVAKPGAATNKTDTANCRWERTNQPPRGQGKRSGLKYSRHLRAPYAVAEYLGHA